MHQLKLGGLKDVNVVVVRLCLNKVSLYRRAQLDYVLRARVTLRLSAFSGSAYGLTDYGLAALSRVALLMCPSRTTSEASLHDIIPFWTHCVHHVGRDTSRHIIQTKIFFFAPTVLNLSFFEKGITTAAKCYKITFSAVFEQKK